MERFILSAIGGYSGSSSPREEKIETVLNSVIDKYKETLCKDLVRADFDSSDINCIETCASWVRNKINETHPRERKKTAIMIVGKSMGGAKLFYIYEKLFTEYLNAIKTVGSFVLFFVDAHGSPLGDASLLPFGKGRNLIIPALWNKMLNLRTVNYYQQNKYPDGAKIENGDKEVLVPKVDHYTIVTSKEVNDGLEEEVVRLIAS